MAWHLPLRKAEEALAERFRNHDSPSQGDTMQLKLLPALVAVGLSAAAAHAQVTDQMIQSEATAKGNVLTWGINTQGQRYSPLKQVNAGNAARLVPVWAFSFGGEKQRGQESQPVIANGKMFVTASYSRIYALDAATGKKL
jgi:alcohol dehydrogenase (cytochrome c)